MQRRDLLAISLPWGLALPASLGRGARAATPAGNPGPDGITRTHAVSLLGEPALPADFPHWPWVNPHAPMAPFIRALNEPILRPLRRFVPLVGGLDLSLLVAVLLLQIVLHVLGMLFGMP